MNVTFRAAAAFASLAMTACVAAVQPSGPERYPGTYRIAICPGACEPGDTAQALAYGTLILEEPSGNTGRACFWLRRKENVTTYAGLHSEGWTPTRWAGLSSGEMQVWMFSSPDANYTATLARTPDGLRGRGESFFATLAGSPRIPLDSIAAVRVGGPDRQRCGRAWAELPSPHPSP